MQFKPEILFIDPSVSDIETLLAGLRPGVEAVLLDADRPAAAQMAQAIVGRSGLAVVHVIAHGSPGRVHFASGEWSRETLKRDAADLRAIGRALRADGDIRLWSCETGKSASGESFVEALENLTGVYVGAASGLVGAEASGGSWVIGSGRQVPIEEFAVRSYAAVLTMYDLTVVWGTVTTPPRRD